MRNRVSGSKAIVTPARIAIKINIKVAREILGKIDMPKHKSAMKELERGRLLFYVTFEGGKGYLDRDVFVRDIINAGN
ncbi:MAG: AccI family restriction endonuclease [Cyanobacteriota bacterium]|nr:AccI family restriction endonuclease [Cyanobacteriota bacterium]